MIALTTSRQRFFVNRILPYRLDAIEVMGVAVRFSSSWTTPVHMEIRFDGKLLIEGLSTGYTNPAIEAGIIHCRALLEFLGLRGSRADHTKLAQREKAKGHGDDLLIEDFATAHDGALALVSPADAIASYLGPPAEAERAFARVIHVANKGLAHSTVGLTADTADHHLLELVSRGVRGMFVRHFYAPLGLAPPRQMLKGRRRDAK